MIKLIHIFVIFSLVFSGCLSGESESSGEPTHQTPLLEAPETSNTPNSTGAQPYLETGTYQLSARDGTIANFEIKITQDTNFLVEVKAHVQLERNETDRPDQRFNPRNYTITGEVSSSTGELLFVEQNPETHYNSFSGGGVSFGFPLQEPNLRNYVSHDRWIPNAPDLNWTESTWGENIKTLTRDLIPIGLQIPILREQTAVAFPGIATSYQVGTNYTTITWTADCHRLCKDPEFGKNTEIQGKMILDNGLLPSKMGWELTPTLDKAELIRLNHSIIGSPQFGVEPIVDAQVTGPGGCGLIPCDGEDWPAAWGFETSWLMLGLNPAHLVWMATQDPPPFLTQIDVSDNTFAIRQQNIYFLDHDWERRVYRFFGLAPDQSGVFVPSGMTIDEGGPATYVYGRAPPVELFSLGQLNATWGELLGDAERVPFTVVFRSYDPEMYPDPNFRYVLWLYFESDGEIVSVMGSPATGEWLEALQFGLG